MKMNHDKAVEVKQSPLWGSIVEELDERLEGVINELKFCSPEDLKIKQAKIMLYEEFKRLPQDVIDRES